MMYYRAQQQMNDVLGFGMSLLMMTIVFGMVRSLVSDMFRPEKSPGLLPQTRIKEPFIRVDERVRYIGTSKYRYKNWPEGTWLQKGTEGTVVEYHPRIPAPPIPGEEAIEAYAVVRWEFGGQTAIDPQYERKQWERLHKSPTARDMRLSPEEYSHSRWPEYAARSYAYSLGFTEKVTGDIAWRNPRNREQLVRLVSSTREPKTITVYHSRTGIREVLAVVPESPPVLPQVMIEGGEPLPPQYRYLVEWVDEPLPGYSLATLDLLPQVGAKERKIDAVLQQLKNGVETIQQSENFRQFLIAMSRFHDYSIGNQILIMIQKPDATRVAGFNTWKELGRWVKRGETGISILAPVFPARETVWQRRDGAEWTVRRINGEWGVYITRTAEGYEPNTLLDTFDTKWDAERQIRDWGGRRVVVEEVRPYEARFFKVVYVFDVSQTEGKPLPEFEVPVLTGEVNEDLFSRLLELVKKQGVEVSFESRPDLPPEIKGQYLAPNRIWVRPEEPRAQQLKTLLHEIAHYYSEGVFHIPRRDAETIAESAAFVVGAHHGFDTGVRSFPYVALWAQEKKVLEENLEAIRRVSTTILESLEESPGVGLAPMIIKCAWCGKYMGEKPPYEDRSVTHSICAECRAKYFPEKHS